MNVRYFLAAAIIGCVFIFGCGSEKANTTAALEEGVSSAEKITKQDDAADTNIGKDVQTMENNFYDFTANALDGTPVSMQKYKGKVVLVVNTASKCGFTKQYAGLQELHEKYKDQGLAILGFPCNQFGQQEPGTAIEIKEFCRINYGVTFDMFEKIDVNGDDAHPLFKYLKEELPSTPGKAVKWNFTKFLIDKNGKPVKRFASVATPQDIEPFIKELL